MNNSYDIAPADCLTFLGMVHQVYSIHAASFFDTSCGSLFVLFVSSVHSDAGGDLLASRSDVIMAALSLSLRRPTVVVSL